MCDGRFLKIREHLSPASFLTRPVTLNIRMSNNFTGEEGDTIAELMRPRSTPPVNPHGNDASMYDPNGRVQFSIDTSIAARNTIPRY